MCILAHCWHLVLDADTVNPEVVEGGDPSHCLLFVEAWPARLPNLPVRLQLSTAPSNTLAIRVLNGVPPQSPSTCPFSNTPASPPVTLPLCAGELGVVVAIGSGPSSPPACPASVDSRPYIIYLLDDQTSAHDWPWLTGSAQLPTFLPWLGHTCLPRVLSALTGEAQGWRFAVMAAAVRVTGHCVVVRPSVHVALPQRATQTSSLPTTVALSSPHRACLVLQSVDVLQPARPPSLRRSSTSGDVRAVSLSSSSQQSSSPGQAPYARCPFPARARPTGRR